MTGYQDPRANPKQMIPRVPFRPFTGEVLGFTPEITNGNSAISAVAGGEVNRPNKPATPPLHRLLLGGIFGGLFGVAIPLFWPQAGRHIRGIRTLARGCESI